MYTLKRESSVHLLKILTFIQQKIKMYYNGNRITVNEE